MTRKQTARRTRQAPPKIEPLIKLANYLPARFDVPHFERPESGDPEEIHAALYRSLGEVAEKAEDLARETEGRRKDPEKDAEDIRERAGRFRRHVLGGLELKASFDEQADEADFDMEIYLPLLHDAAERYEDFLALREQLELFSLGQQLLTLGRQVYKTSEELSARGLDQLPVKSGVRFRVDGRGTLRIAIAEFLQAFDGVELDRIGQCRVCGRYFWVGRRGVICCSPACGNIYNNGVRRGKYKKDRVRIKFQKMEAAERRERRRKKQDDRSRRVAP